MKIHKGFAPGSGLGSSAASAAAAAVACNALVGAGLSKEELLECALLGEQVASGARHADNVAPSVLGGFVLVRGYDPLDVVELPTPATLWCAIVRPHITISTRASRRLLPSNVPLSDVVTQTGNAAGLVAGLLMGDFRLISRSLHDVIAEPYRAKSYRGLCRHQTCSPSGRGAGMQYLRIRSRCVCAYGRSDFRRCLTAHDGGGPGAIGKAV